MEKWKILMMIVFSFLINSCEKEIITKADFESDFATYLSPDQLKYYPRFPVFERIKFLDRSINADQYYWDFGNGELSSEREPTVFYEQGGEYNVTLKTVSQTGNVSITSKKITIHDLAIKKIALNCKYLYSNMFSLKELGWISNRQVHDIILDIGVLEKIDSTLKPRLIYSSHVLKNINRASQSVELIPKENIQIPSFSLFGDDTYRILVIQLSAVDNKGKHLFYSSQYFPGRTTYFDFYDTGMFRIESGKLLSVDCIYK